MKKGGTKRETDTELLVRTMAEGFGEVSQRFDGIDGRLGEMSGDIKSLQKGQTETNRRLDTIEQKQTGMLESLDETVHQNEFRKLVQRVEVLEK